MTSDRWITGDKLWQMHCPPPPSEWAEADYGGEMVWPGVWDEPEPGVAGEIEWKPGSTTIGDFTWPHGFAGALHVVAKADAAKKLTANFSGATLLDVRVAPPEDGRQRSNQIPHPYDGPPLHVLWITQLASADEKMSTYSDELTEYGFQQKVYHGVEEWDYDWNADWDAPTDPGFAMVHKERKPSQGMFVPEQELAGNDFVRLRQWPGAHLCTDKVRDFVIAHSFTNIIFLEVGNVITC